MSFKLSEVGIPVASIFKNVIRGAVRHARAVIEQGAPYRRPPQYLSRPRLPLLRRHRRHLGRFHRPPCDVNGACVLKSDGVSNPHLQYYADASCVTCANVLYHRHHRDAVSWNGSSNRVRARDGAYRAVKMRRNLPFVETGQASHGHPNQIRQSITIPCRKYVPPRRPSIMKKTVVVIGAGPAGLVTAKTLLEHSTPALEFDPVILEAEDDIGGTFR